MTYNKLLLEGESLLKESGLDKCVAKLLLLECASLNSTELYLQINDKAHNKAIYKFRKLLNKYIKTSIPPQYLLKSAYFFGNKFYINKNVLIPRPETEGLVALTINELNKLGNNLNIIDVGTGSGCIGITLNKKFTNHNFFAIDISKKALKVAKKNNNIHQTNVKFILSDLFENIKNIKFDIVVANLPYVRDSEELDKTVSYEPQLALFAGSDGTKLYQRFFKQVFDYLNEDGVILIEHEYLNGKIIKDFILSMNNNLEIEKLKDLSNRDRYLIVRGFKNE